MTHFFFQRISEEGRWALISEEILESAESFELAADPSKPILRRQGGGTGEAARIMRYSDAHGNRGWVLFGSGSGVRVNGLGLPTGIRLLEDRDEVVVGAENRFVFSAETIAEVRPFRAGAEEINCALCTGLLEEGEDSVKCPGCGAVYHEIAEGPKPRRCFTYAPQCKFCKHSTELGGGFKWMPDDDFRQGGGES